MLKCSLNLLVFMNFLLEWFFFYMIWHNKELMIDHPIIAVRHEAIDAELILKVCWIPTASAVAFVLPSKVEEPIKLIVYESPWTIVGGISIQRAVGWLLRLFVWGWVLMRFWLLCLFLCLNALLGLNFNLFEFF